MSLELHNGVQFRVRLQKIMIQYTSSPGAYDQRGKQLYVLRTRVEKRGARKRLYSHIFLSTSASSKASRRRTKIFTELCVSLRVRLQRLQLKNTTKIRKLFDRPAS
jgi:hypothetical protein